MPDSSVASRRAAARSVGVVGLAVPAQLDPAAEPRVQGEQRVLARRVEHAAPRRSGGPARRSGGRRRPGGRPGRPGRPACRARWASVRRAPSAASSAAGDRGAGSPLEQPASGPRAARRERLGGHADGDRAERLPVGGQVQDRARRPRRRSSTRPSTSPRPSAASATSSDCTAAPPATVNIVRSPAAGVVGVGVHAVAGAEGEHELGGPAQEVAAAHPALDLVGRARRRPQVCPPARRPCASSSAVRRSRHAARRTGTGCCGAARARSAPRRPRGAARRGRPARRRSRGPTARSSTASRRPCASASSVPSRNRSSSSGRTRSRAVEPSSVGSQAAHHRHRHPAELALHQVGGRRELVGHRDLGDEQLVALRVDHAARSGAAPRAPPSRSRRRSARPARRGPWCR